MQNRKMEREEQTLGCELTHLNSNTGGGEANRHTYPCLDQPK